MSTTFPENSWLLDRDELLALYKPDVEQPFPPNCGIRVLSNNPSIGGYREFVLLEEGLAVISSDVQYSEQVKIEHPDRPIVKFHFRLTGGSSINVGGGNTFSRVADQAGGALFIPSAVSKSEVAFAGKHEQSITIACSAQWLMRQIGAELDLLPDSLAAYARGEQKEFFYLPITMRTGISQAALALLSCELSGQARRMFFLSKAIEIMSLSIDVLMSERNKPEHLEHRISKLDYEQLRELRRRIQTDFSVTLKVGDLADQIGMNASRMMVLFKRRFGESVFDFSQRSRMEFAAKLLEATDRPITEIAFDVGYDYPSNFTTAFKRHFGVSPKAVRQVSPQK